MKMKKFLMIGILMALGVSVFGIFGFIGLANAQGVPPVITALEVKDKNNVLISDNGTLWDHDINPVTITSNATASPGRIIWLHGIQFTIDGSTYLPPCNPGPVATCEVDICSIVDCSTQLLPNSTITYSSTAIDNLGGLGSSTTKSFSVGTTWAKAFSSPGASNIFSIQQNSNGEYIGRGEGLGVNLIFKLDNAGSQLWFKDFGGGDFTRFIQQTSDGGCILAKSIWQFFGPLPANHDILVIKLDSAGDKQWAKPLGTLFNNQSVIHGLVKTTSDGGYILGGDSSFFGPNHSPLIIRLNSAGAVIWSKIFDNGGEEEDVYFIQQTDDDGDGQKDDGYIVLASREIVFGSNYDFLVIKLDSAGNLGTPNTWAKSYGDAGFEHVRQIHQTSDGGYIMSGESSFYGGAGGSDFLVIKLDSDGTIVWDNAFGDISNDLKSSVKQTTDGGYILDGTLKYAISRKGVVIKLDSAGNFGTPGTWAKSYNEPGNNSNVRSIQQTLDGGYVTAGSTTGNDIWVLKLDNNGNIANCDSIITDVSGSIVQTNITMGEANLTALFVQANDPMNEPGDIAFSGNLNPTTDRDPCGPCNTAPTVMPNAPDIPTDLEYCTVSPEAISLSWNFSDTEDGAAQTAYQLTMTRSDGATFDFTKTVSPTTTITCQAVNILSAGFVRYGGETYGWRVKVWDSGGLTDTELGISFTTPAHKYPCADFTFNPANPLAGDDVSFDALGDGGCVGSGSQAYGAGVPIVDYSWDFDGDSIIDASGALPTANYTYIAEGSYSIELIVTDSSGFSCPSCAQTINVDKGMPKWKEVVPR